MSEFKVADLHIHSSCSDGKLKPPQIVKLALANHLDAIAITDHEIIKGALEAKKYCQERGFKLEVVVGVELTTSDGHLNGLFIQDDIPSGKSAEWTIEAIHEQGGLAIAAHPGHPLTRSLSLETVLSVANNPHPNIYWDGFEIYSSTDAPTIPFININANNNAEAFYRTHPGIFGAEIGGTDAHFRAIGRGLTKYQGNLKEAIANQATRCLSRNIKKEISPLDYLQNAYMGMVIEPGRRVIRYAERELFECLGSS